MLLNNSEIEIGNNVEVKRPAKLIAKASYCQLKEKPNFEIPDSLNYQRVVFIRNNVK